MVFWRPCVHLYELISNLPFFLGSAFDHRLRSASHPSLQIGRLLDRPPSAEARGHEPHLLPARAGELRHHGERWRGQSLSRALPLQSEYWYPETEDTGVDFYRAGFTFYHLLQYHHSFTAMDPSLGPLVLSVCLEDEENRLRVILRFLICSVW